MQRPGQRLHSIPAGDLVMAMLPPIYTMNWLAAGIVRLAGILREAGIQPRITRVMQDWRRLPPAIIEGGYESVARDLPLDQRIATAQAACDAAPGFLDGIVDRLLDGPERVFAFSVWRSNVDLSLVICRHLRARCPDAFILLGGPEAIENGAQLQQPYVDAVVSAPADAHVLPIVRAVLDGAPGRIRGLPDTWLHPRHGDHPDALGPADLVAPDIQPFDYADVLPLLLCDPEPHVPITLNVGCPYNCGFCTNRPIYGRIRWGTIDRFVAEVQQLSEAWAALTAGKPVPLVLELCDAAMNGNPRQFEQLCDALAAADLPVRPRLRGMVVIDRQFTGSLVEKMMAAGFDFVFVGFETASPRVRKAMSKPGSIEEVQAGLEAAARVARGRLGFALGVISGWPDETEAEHNDTVRFLEWFSQLDGLNTHAILSPLYRVPSPQDQPTFAAMRGEAQGVLWHSDGPGGSPELRLRRVLSIFERMSGILSVEASVPMDLLMRWMAPDLPPAFIARWHEKHGRMRDFWRDRHDAG